MERLRRAALLSRLIEKLRERESRCGEPHVQKAAFFLQELMDVPLGFTFIMYKDGPYSFDLRDDLTGLRADEIVRLEPQWPSGPRIGLTDRSRHIKRMYVRTLQNYEDEIDSVATWLGPKGLADLERCGTALFVTRHADLEGSVDSRVEEVVRRRPHVSRRDARVAVEEVGRQMERVANRQ